MARELFKTGYGKSHTRLFLSDDWKSKTPWRHNNVIQPYFSKVSELSESGAVKFIHWYIGPFAILYARWVS